MKKALTQRALLGQVNETPGPSSGRLTMFRSTIAVLFLVATTCPALAQDVRTASLDLRTLFAGVQGDASSFLSVPARLSVEEVPLSEGLEALRDRSAVPLAFSPSRTKDQGRISCACADLTVGEALQRMLSGTDFTFVAMDHRIVIERRDQAVVPTDSSDRGGTSDGQPKLYELPRLRPIGPPAQRHRTRTGTVAGRVIAAGTGQPLSGSQVQIVGTDLGTVTGGSGRYEIAEVPAGEIEVRVQRLGYRTMTREVTLESGETVTVDFQLPQEAIGLDEIVITGTAGGTQRRAIGNVVSTISAEQIMEQSPITQADQLIAQRSPGVMMLPSTGQIGTGSNPRIRGISSITQGAEPIIYIDGIRMDSDVSGGRSGGPSRLNDLDPADIASMEIIKGPAAATLYGTEASHGVIQIFTRRGESGAPQFDVSLRQGTNWMWNPEERAGLRFMPDPDNPGERIGVNIYEQERLHGNGPIFGYGQLQSQSLSLRGGTETLRYYAALSRDHDVGIVDHNWQRRIGVRGNLEAVLTDNLTMTLSTSLNRGQIRLSEGLAATASFRNVVWAIPANTEARGFRTSPPEVWSLVENRVDNDRSTASLEVQYQPTDWWTHRLVAGIDLNSEVEWLLIPRMTEENAQFLGAVATGSKSVNRGTRSLLTVDYSGSATFDWRDYTFTPSIGFQYYNTESSFIGASGSEFPAIPITTVAGAAARSGGETFSENATVGGYVQQQVGWNDRAFLTAAVRADDNSAFGTEFDAAIYPKLSATWVISEEAFWTTEFVNQLRLRAAWGAAGQQPGTFDAARLFDPFIGSEDQPALSPGSFGNPELQPERSEELEIGFDASLFDGRLDLEVTHYRRDVKDAIVNRPLPPSTGFTGAQIVNIGRLENWGTEFGASAALVEGDRFGWNLDVQLATMDNEINSLGGLDVIPAGTQSQHREGYSIADIFMIRILDAEIDDNANVLAATCDGGTGPQGVDPGGAPVPCSEAPQVWLGHSQPTWQVGVGNTFRLFENLSLYARVEGNGGHIHNATEVRATHNLGTTDAVLRRDNPLLHAYRALENDRTGIYDAGFLRFRELSLTYRIPESFVQRVGAQTASVSVGMRNVAMLWTAQHGWSTPRDGHIVEGLGDMIVWDPETRGTGSTSVGFQQNVPQTASALMTLRLSF